jgi:isocitrate dehydrogenase (NAD+)
MDITVIRGDGIGPEIMDATLAVLEAAEAPFTWRFATAGEAAQAECGDPLPKAVLDAVSSTGLALKGPLSTPSGGGYVSVNVRIRKAFDLYANVRPAKTLVRGGRYEGVDLVMFRENVEGLYSGEEFYEEADGDPRGRGVIRAGNSRAGMRRFLDLSYRWAIARGRKRMTIVHKANILKIASGIFLDTALEIGERHSSAIHTDTLIVDDCGQQLVLRPEKFEAIATTNLFGDILSDVAAGTVGGLGLAPSANIGDRAAVFEAVHGSAPSLAGKDIANPTALVLASAMLLDHVGEPERAAEVRAAVRAALDAGERTRDLGGSLGTRAYADRVISRLRGRR